MNDRAMDTPGRDDQEMMDRLDRLEKKLDYILKLLNDKPPAFKSLSAPKT